MTSWLNKQKKKELQDLASTAGYRADDDLRKDELITNLDEYLQKNATRLQGQAAFEPYYGTRRPTRPRDSVGNVTSDIEEGAKSVARKTVKKATKVKADIENTGANFLASPAVKVMSDVASRISTPFVQAERTAAHRLSNMNVALPNSPTEAAENVERAATKFYAGAEDLYSVSGIPETLDWVRTTCSSVIGVQTSILLLEAYALQKAVFPWNFAFDLPGVPAFGIPSIAIKYPDFSVFLRSSFWGPTILWAITSIILPHAFAYFYNLTVHSVKRNGARVQALRYPYDPMTYSIAKAVITMLVYGVHAPYDYVDVKSARVVERAMIGGYEGVLTGCFITGVAALWEAAQR